MKSKTTYRDSITGNFYQYTSGFPDTLLACTNFSTWRSTVNIDADELGNFTIVWDDLNENRIIAQGGGCMTNSSPSLGGRAVVRNGAQFTMPDASMIKRTCSPNCYSEAFVTYVDNTNNKNYLYVDGGYFEDWIIANNCDTINPYLVRDSLEVLSTSSQSAQFLYPRIACPTYTSNTDYKYNTVVVEIFDQNNTNGFTDDIVGYTTNSSNFPIHNLNIYTDGGVNSPCAIDNNNNDRNQFPVVTYDNTGNGMMVGWQSQYTADLVFKPFSLAAILCDGNDGKWDKTTCNIYYLIIPKNNFPSFTYQSFLSLSGRDYTDVQYTFYDDIVPDVVYKDDPYGTCNLKSQRKKSLNNQQAKVFPNPFENELSLQIVGDEQASFELSVVDLFGKSLFSTLGNENNIKVKLNNFLKDISPGVYYLNILNDSRQSVLNSRIIKIK